jgi:hypothetical protein
MNQFNQKADESYTPPTVAEIIAASDGDHIEVGESERGNFLVAHGKLWVLESFAALALMRAEDRLIAAESSLGTPGREKP